MLITIYKFELKKLFFARVNMIAMAGSVIMLVFLVISSLSESIPASREAERELDGRVIDGQLFEEIEPVLQYENGMTVLKITEGYEQYVPILNMIMPITGDEFDFSRFQGMGFYDLRMQRIQQRFEKQGLTDAEIAYWEELDAKVAKPFIYHYHSGPRELLKSFQALGFFILLLSDIRASASVLPMNIQG